MEAEAACNEGLVLDPSNAGLLDMLATCKLETCETPEVQAQLAKMRQDARSHDQLNELLSKMGGGGQGGPQVFNMSNLNASGGGLQDLLSGMGGGGMGGMGGGGKPKMSDAQMRQVARAMTSGGPLPTSTTVATIWRCTWAWPWPFSWWRTLRGSWPLSAHDG